MSESMPGLSRDEVDGFRLALTCLAPFEGAGLPVKLWEAYCIALHEGSLLRRELRRLDGAKGEVSPGTLEKVRILRDKLGPLMGKLRKIVSAAVTTSQDPLRQEIILGLIATSPAGRAAALRWISEPERFHSEAFEKIAILDRVVDSQGVDIRRPLMKEEQPPGPVESAPAPAPPEVPEETPSVEPSTRAAAPPEAPIAASIPVPAPPAPPPRPSAPARLVATPQRNQIHLAWAEVPGADRYAIKRSTRPSGPYSVIAAQVPGAGHIDLRIVDGVTYYYVVIATGPGGESPHSAEVSAVHIPPPAAPTNLIAGVGDHRISLAWNAVPGAKCYNVKRGRTAGGPFSTIAQVLETTFADQTVENGTAYHFVTAAVNDGGESPASNEIAATAAPPPPAPSRLAARPGNGQVSLSWESASQGATYSVWRSLSSASGRERIATGLAASAHVDSNVRNGTEYFYTVTALNPGGESPSSTEARATPVSPPAAPGDPAAKPGDGHVVLSWMPAAGAERYRIKRSTDADTPVQEIGTSESASYVDRSVQNGTTYTYVVCAENAGGDSPLSPQVRATPVALPAAPADVAARSGNGQATLTWSTSAGAERYHVKRSTTIQGSFREIGTTELATYVDSGLENGSTYFYIVIARNAAGESPASSTASATATAPPPAPKDVVASPGNGEVTLTWSPVEGGRRYRIKRSVNRRGPYKQIAIAGETRFVDRTVANGTAYFYIVSASNAGGTSPHSPRVEATPNAPPPPPAALAASGGNGKVSLIWEPVRGATSYQVLRSPDGAPPWAELARVETMTFVDSSVENGKRFIYAVRALGPGGESDLSTSAPAMPQGPPPAPTELAAQAGDATVTLRWTAAAGASCYALMRGESPEGPFTPLGNCVPPTYTDQGLTNGKTYFYKVLASNSAGESPETPLLSVIPIGSPTNAEPPGDESSAEFRLPSGAPRGLSSNLDLEKLLDLKRVGALRSIFEATAQRIEVWEVLWIISQGGYDARRAIERLVRLKEAGESPDLHEQAANFFEQILKARSEAGAKVEKIRKFIGSLNLAGQARETADIALGLIVSSAKGRKRAESWLAGPEESRQAAAGYLEHALELAKRYQAKIC